MDCLAFAAHIGAPVNSENFSSYEKAMEWLSLNEGEEYIDPGYFPREAS